MKLGKNLSLKVTVIIKVTGPQEVFFKHFLPSNLWLQALLFFQIIHCDCESIVSFSFLLLRASLSFPSAPRRGDSGTQKKMQKQNIYGDKSIVMVAAMKVKSILKNLQQKEI